MEHVGVYLLMQAKITVGSLIGFLIRNEHRLTRLETKMENIEKRQKCQTS